LGLELDIYKNIGLKKLKERADKIYQNKQFSEKVRFALGEIAREKKKSQEKKKLAYEDKLVSGGFPDEQDQNTMEEFQLIDEWSKKNHTISKIKDLRYKHFGKRLIYQNQPEVLSKDEYKEIQKDIAKKILSVEETNFTTIPMAESLIDNMRNEKGITKEKLDYVNDIDAYISDIRKVYEKAL
jgi:exodeoxyribonuclease-1